MADKRMALRLFKNDGVELFEEDLKYLKDNDVLYVSQGEDFNQENVINEFEQMESLGEGGFGTVVRAEHRVSKQHVAMKFVKKDIV
jgi:serine/threonine protein kinase